MGNPDSEVQGLYFLAAKDIFLMCNEEQYSDIVIGISFYDIYCGKAYDLLKNRQKCAIRVDKKNNVNIVGLSEMIISNTQSLMQLIYTGL